MKKNNVTLIDAVSTFMAGAVLYHLEAQWWAYLLMLLFGACQQIVGREKGKAAILKRAVAVIIRRAEG